MISNTTVGTLTTLLLVPPATTYAVVSIWFCNTNTETSSATNLDVFFVPSSGSADSTTQVIKNLTVEAADTFRLDSANDKIILATGDSIIATSSLSGLTATPVFLEI